MRSVAPPNEHPDTRSDANDQCLEVQGAIWRAVAEAAVSEASFSLNEKAQAIARAFPESGFSRQDIKDALVFAAVDEGAVVMVGPAGRSAEESPEPGTEQGYVPFIEIKAMIRAAGRKRRSRKGGRSKTTGSDMEAPLRALA